MAARSDQAVVIRLSDYSETSQIVTLMTAGDGLVRLIGKGMRRSTAKRFAAGLDLLELGDAAYVPPRSGSGLGTLTEWVQRDTFAGLRNDLQRVYGGVYAAELCATLTEEYDPHPELFDALAETLRSLCGTDQPVDVVVAFQMALLQSIGYLPALDRCVSCGRARPSRTAAFFSSRAGGLLCRNCEMNHAEKRRVAARVLDHAPGGVTAENGNIPRSSELRREWFDLLNYHLSSIAGREFATGARLGAALAETQRSDAE